MSALNKIFDLAQVPDEILDQWQFQITTEIQERYLAVPDQRQFHESIGEVE